MNQLQPDPWTLCVSAAHFAEHLQVITRLSPRPWVTFDDGYADNLLHALPVLEKHDVPACFFIVSGAIGRHTEMWWDALDLLCPEPVHYQCEFARLRLLPLRQQEEQLEVLFDQQHRSRAPRPGRRMLTVEELLQLARSPLVEIGAHTVTHPVLSQLSLDQQDREIRDSQQWLKTTLQRNIESFSYPNGMAYDYTADTIELVRQAGFERAYSAFEHTRADTFQIPRVMIRDWDGEEFARVLAGSLRSSA